MQRVATKKVFEKVEFWAFTFIVIHLTCWTLLPTLIRFNLPLDAIEGSLWGHQLEWGYDKNPFLNGWLTALAIYLGGTSGWMVYLFSQLSVAICLFAVWQLARKMLSPVHALLAVLLLEGVQYYHFHAIDFNDNTLELSLWALSSLFLYQALRRQKNNTREWIFTGFFAGLGMMAKYYTAALLTAMLLLIVLRAENRKQLLTLPFYLGLITFLIVITPHLVWLFNHHFITVQYVFERASSQPSWINHLFYPAQFIWQQFEAFIPAIILCLPLLLSKKQETHDQVTVKEFDKAFLFYIGMLPLLLTALLSVIFGIKLRAGWGMPLLSLWGIILIALTKPVLTTKKLYYFIAIIFLLMMILGSGYSFSLMHSNSTSTANYPGKEIAQEITTLWHQQYHRKLNYVAGSRWIGGNISLYSPDHPAVFMEWNDETSPWINLADMDREGAVFVWEIIDDGEDVPEEVKTQFPRLLSSRILKFRLHRNDDNRLPLIEVGVALLPPNPLFARGEGKT